MVNVIPIVLWILVAALLYSIFRAEDRRVERQFNAIMGELAKVKESQLALIDKMRVIFGELNATNPKE